MPHSCHSLHDTITGEIVTSHTWKYAPTGKPPFKPKDWLIGYVFVPSARHRLYEMAMLNGMGCSWLLSFWGPRQDMSSDMKITNTNVSCQNSSQKNTISTAAIFRVLLLHIDALQFQLYVFALGLGSLTVILGRSTVTVKFVARRYGSL